MNRQRIRRTIIFISCLLFPITIYYFSPYIIIQAMSQHILNGSFWVFSAMLILSVFGGRVWCGYLCPAGGLQECCTKTNDGPAKQGFRDWIKFIIWGIWMVAVICTFILGKNGITVDFFYMTDHGISIAEIYSYIIYYGILILLFLPAMIHGRRAACHYICWMAPFMIIGGFIGRKLHLPQLHIEAKPKNCVSCKKCNQVCPMGLDVENMVQAGKNASCSECVQCGACVDTCPQKVLSYQFTWKGGNVHE